MLTLPPWTSTHNSSAKAQIHLRKRNRGATSDFSLLPCLADKVFHRTISMQLFSSPPTLWHIDFLRSYKANTASAETIVVDEETGQEKKRLINRMRWKGFGPTEDSWASEFDLRNAQEILRAFLHANPKDIRRIHQNHSTSQASQNTVQLSPHA